MREEYIQIKRLRHEALLESEDKLEALEQSGVDNWSGYGEAMELLEESEDHSS